MCLFAQNLKKKEGISTMKKLFKTLAFLRAFSYYRINDVKMRLLRKI